MELYPWLVFTHIAGALLFALGHGASALMSFRVRAEREPARIAALLDLSSMSTGTMYVGLLLLLIGGIWAGIVGGWFTRSGWIWAALVLLVVISGSMYAMGSRYYARVRNAVGQRSYLDKKDAPDPEPASPEELATLLDTRQPELIAAVGGLGLLVILWLMVLKPF